MASEVTNYKCPACTAPLRYSSETGRLECDWCGSSYSVEEMEAIVADKERAAEEAFEKSEQKRAVQTDDYAPPPTGAPVYVPTPPPSGEKWDTSGLTDDWGGDADAMRTYNCPSCGAELLCEATTAATSCPYCGNVAIVPGQLSGVLKPDFVIPFKLDKKQAEAALAELYKGKFFLPKRFKLENIVKEMHGIYVPLWLFDGGAYADVLFEGTISRCYRQGEYDVTETDHYNVRRAGSLAFEKIPADASMKMPDDLMDSLEPYDYSDLKPFSTAYLPGHLADKYDVTADECHSRADERCTNTAIDVMRQTVVGYQAVATISQQVQLTRGKVHYALFPVYMMYTRWNDREFVFAVNGQTGKMVGELPTSWPKFWITFAIIAVIVTIIALVAIAFLG